MSSKTTRKPLEDVVDNEKTVEEIYQKKTQLEHILLRPDTYIGSIEKLSQPMWVFDETTKQLVFRNITYVPGLYKIFDEILVNAADNKQRDDSMNLLKVTIDADRGEISVWNNGKGIPVVEHKEHQVYIPELIFGHLLTGSNFDDKKKKTTGGRNGYGAKLANIFSSEFIVETASSTEGKQYKQRFFNNMNDKDAPSIKPYKKEDYTCITFKPDLERFHMTHLDDDIIGLFKKRVYDIAGVATTGKLKVMLNGGTVPINSFSKYVQLYNVSSTKKKSTLADEEIEEAPCSVIFDKPSDRWQVGVGLSDDGFQQVSFVNCISTSKGGQHVNYIMDQVVQRLVTLVKKKNKGEAVKPAYIKNHLFIYVTALIENPAFDSQTKENLTTRPKSFGSSYDLSEKFLKQVEKSGIVDRILQYAKFKQSAELRRQGGGKQKRLTGITKLDDANFAGTSKSGRCTLILTEGDSAKALAMSGLSVVGRDYYGVFPLKGKLLNVREAAHSVIKKNEEIQNIAKIIGLKHGQEYTSTKSLRYGHLMIMADQDHDGSHIKGLVINMIHHFWPSLLKIENFLQEFITPIVKVSKGKQSKVFYTMPEYEEWKGTNTSGWSVKYYKGLGTSTAKEAKEYFSDLGTHQISFSYEGDTDSDAIELAFAKSRIEDRKNWLREYRPGDHVDYDVEKMPYQEFVNKELILFSMADNVRSIPSLIDGFKPSQRKILFSCFKRKLKSEIKVAQLAGYCSEHGAYHHGEMSLTGTIINMAQDFVGSNNINLLTPSGQFGTRLMGGKDAASPRYVFTNVEKITRIIFNPLDDPLLDYLEEDGQQIEPTFYVPIIPMVLVNGSDGIGTGWSTSVPNYNPKDIIQQIKRRINGHEIQRTLPWYRSFTGEILPKKSDTFIVKGKYEVISDNTFIITELPIKSWTQNYKQHLEALIQSNDIKDFKENHTDTTVHFTIECLDTPVTKSLEGLLSKPEVFIKKFKLEASLSSSNMHMFNESNQIQKFSSPEDVMNAFYPVRLEYYQKRKDYMLQQLEQEIKILSNKSRFVSAIVSGEFQISNRKKTEIIKDLKKSKFDMIDSANKPTTDDDDNAEEGNNGYDYLLSMKLWSLTNERIVKLQAELQSKESEHEKLDITTIKTLWLQDLDELETVLSKMDIQESSIDLEELAATMDDIMAKERAVQEKKELRKEKKANKTTAKTRHDGEPREGKGKTKKTAKATILDDDNDFEVKAKPQKSDQKIRQGKQKATKTIVLDDDEDDEDDEMMSLAQRLKRKVHVTPKKNTNKIDDDDEDDIFEEVVAKKPPVVKGHLKRRKENTPKKAHTAVMESPYRGPSPLKKKACPEKKPSSSRPATRVRKQPIVYQLSSSDEDGNESAFEEEDEEEDYDEDDDSDA